jgi:Cdc6-like AAA superfamily ATPase
MMDPVTSGCTVKPPFRLITLPTWLMVQVLYQLFDWPHHPGSRLAVIGISNTHDLDQRVLPRIASRLDQAKLAFAPYSVQQLLTIVNARLQDSGVGGAVEEVAVQLACRKVAAETGEVQTLHSDVVDAAHALAATLVPHTPAIAVCCCGCR